MLTEDVFLNIGSFALYTLGVALATGFLTTTVVAIPETRRLGIRRRTILDVMLVLMVTTVIGARVTSIISNWNAYSSKPLSVFSFPSDGLSYYGGLVVGIIVVGLFAFRRNMQLWRVLDVLTPPAALGIAVACAIVSSTNLLHWQVGTIPWISLFLFTIVYGCAHYLWRARGKVRFDGELILLFLGLDSVIRILFGYVWALGNGPFSSVRASFVTLVIAATLWFVRRGASVRTEAAARDETPLEARAKIRPMPWVIGYAVLVILILVRHRAGLA